MTVYEELLKATDMEPRNLVSKDVNKFLLGLVDHVSDPAKFSDIQWNKLSFEAQSYVNACITVLENSEGPEGSVLLEFPEGLVLSTPEKNSVSPVSTPAKKKVRSKTAPKKRTESTNQTIDFDALMSVVWHNPTISKEEFIKIFPGVKRSTLVLYRSILLRAVEHFKNNPFVQILKIKRSDENGQ